MVEPCRLDSCVHFSEEGRLNCNHKEYAKQDVRPKMANDCKFFEASLELVLRKGDYYIRNCVTNKEIEYDREADAFSTEGEKKLDAMADKLQVRRKDIWAISLGIPASLPKDVTYEYIKERKCVIFKRGGRPLLPVRLHTLETTSGRKRTAETLSIDSRVLDGLVADVIQQSKPEKKVKVKVEVKEMKKKPELTDEIKQQAEELLNDPLLLFRIKKDMDRRIVGEDEEKLLQLVLNASCQSKRDYAFQILAANSAAGKSYKTRHTLAYLPKEWYETVGRLSRTSLDYLGDRDFQLLWIQERTGGKEAASSIRLSSIDDGGTKIWVTERNSETGQFETREYTVPGRSVVTTTTSTKIDAQDLTRSWMLGVDESKEQTVSIHDYEAEEAATPLEFKEAMGIAEDDLRPVIQQALRQLRWDYVVIVPFAKQLKKLVDPTIVRSRRDLPKLIRLVRVIALLHQKQRTSFEKNGNAFLVSYPEDLFIALRIAEKTFQRTAMGLDKREKQIIELLQKIQSSTKRQIAEACKKSLTWTLGILQSLTSKGYVDVDENQRTHFYSLRNPENPFQLSPSVFNRISWADAKKDVESLLSQSIASVTPGRRVPRENGKLSENIFDPITGEKVDFSTSYVPPGVTVPIDRVEPATSSVQPTQNENVLETDGDRIKQSISDKKPFSGVKEIDIQTVLSIKALDPATRGNCPLCPRKDVNLVWQVLMMDGSRYDAVCMNCGGYLEEKLRE